MTRSPIKSTWNIEAMLIRGPLTDRKIAEYQRQGYYSDGFRQARRELMDRKARRRRIGDYEVVDGRMIYRPK